jgi:cardiolipin synthase
MQKIQSFNNSDVISPNVTRWKLHTHGEEAWTAMLAACEKAERSIDLEQFIFVDDVIGKRFMEVCSRKAGEGVKVRFLWDAAGSFSFFGSTIADNLKKKGVELVFFKTLVPGFFHLHDYRSYFLRNHRRTLVVDGRIGFTGGIGVWEKMRDWRDTHVEIEGPVVSDMQAAFENMWSRAKGKRYFKIAKSGKKNKRNHGDFTYETNNPLPGKRHIYYRLVDVIRGAKKSVYITTPYFVPTARLFRVIRLAAHRGVDVRIILPKTSDHPVVDLAASSYFDKLIDAGVKIFFYKGSAGIAGKMTNGESVIIHTKTIIIDNEWSTVGTLNLDTISLLYNFEANIISTNLHFAAELSENFWADIRQSEWLDPKDWRRRIFLQKVPEFLVRFVRKFL